MLSHATVITSDHITRIVGILIVIQNVDYLCTGVNRVFKRPRETRLFVSYLITIPYIFASFFYLFSLQLIFSLEDDDSFSMPVIHTIISSSHFVKVIKKYHLVKEDRAKILSPNSIVDHPSSGKIWIYVYCFKGGLRVQPSVLFGEVI